MSGIFIAVIGDYDPGRPSHRATEDSVLHCARHLGLAAQVRWYPTEELAGGIPPSFAEASGVWCSPGSPYRSMEGALQGIRFAREQGIPFLGTCGGFQHAVIEYARNKLGLDAGHQEINPESSSLFITALSCSLLEQSQPIFLKEGSRVREIYGKSETTERYNCSFGLNPHYQQLLDEGGFRVAGVNDAGEARVLEDPLRPFYVATLFQPQLSSAPEQPHRLICAYLNSAAQFQSGK